jgi:hypothetical protein
MCLEHSDISSNRRILVHPDIFSIILQRETNCKRKRINDNKYTKKFSYLYNWKKRYKTFLLYIIVIIKYI